ncbi:MAG: UDP-3-O-(3-hydroxymyristoyl)glucosamine N-acyltransferase [Candidatus Zixiibacteriota bacterium]
MTRTVAELAALLGARVEGDGTTPICGVAPIDTATAGHLTFLANPKYTDRLKDTHASAVIVATAVVDSLRERRLLPRGTLIVHDDPYYAFLRILVLFNPPPASPPPGIDATAVVGQRVHIGERVHVGPHCVIADDATVGDGSVIMAGSYAGAKTVLGSECMIGPNATILRECTLGSRVRIHPGTVIGSDGFGYAPIGGKHEKIPQVGGVTIGDDVEIGAGCTVDRATMGQTTIGRGTKIDNLVQIAHNVQIGEDCIIIAQVGISGSTKIGDHVTIAGQAGIVGHLEIGDNAVVAAQSGVGKSIPPGTVWLGTPAHEIGLQRRIYATISSLPDHVKTIHALEKRLAALEEQLAARIVPPTKP